MKHPDIPTPVDFFQSKCIRIKKRWHSMDAKVIDLIHFLLQMHRLGLNKLFIAIDEGNFVHTKLYKKVNRPGPKPGSGKRTDKLLIRCMPELHTVLQALQKDSWSFKGMSTADILHIMVGSAAKTQFLNGCSDEVENAVDTVCTVGYMHYNNL